MATRSGSGARKKPAADIEEAYGSMASCILANLAVKSGRKFTGDAQKQQIVNDPKAKHCGHGLTASR
jgi:hypothetical protein